MRKRFAAISSSPRAVYWGIATLMILIVGWAAFQTPLGAYFTGSDYWPHAAAIKEWSSHLADPSHPQIAGAQATSLFVPANLGVTLVAAALNLAPITAMGVAAILNLAILLGGMYAFGRVYFADRWAPLLVLGAFTLGWGIALPWSGFVQARSLLFVASYPSVQALGLAWGAIALAVALMRGLVGGWLAYLGLGLGATFVVASHPLSGGLLILATALAALTEKSSWNVRVGALVSVLSSLLLAEAWPWHSFWRTVTSQSGIATNQPVIADVAVNQQFRDLAQIALALGPLLLGIGAAWMLARRRQHPFIVLGFAATTAVFAIDLAVNLPLGHRFLHFSGYFMGLALVGLALAEPRLRKTAWTVAGATIAGNVILVGLTLGGYLILPPADATSYDWSEEPLVAEMRALTAPLGADSVVLADPEFADPIAAFDGKVVALSWSGTDGLLPNGEDLLADTQLFLRTSTKPSTREAIIERRSVTHVLFDSTDLPVESVTQHGQVVAEAGELVMVEIAR